MRAIFDTLLAHCFVIVPYCTPFAFKKLAKYIVNHVRRVHYNNLYPYYTDIVHFSKNKHNSGRRMGKQVVSYL